MTLGMHLSMAEIPQALLPHKGCHSHDTKHTYFILSVASRHTLTSAFLSPQHDEARDLMGALIGTLGCSCQRRHACRLPLAQEFKVRCCQQEQGRVTQPVGSPSEPQPYVV